MRIGQGFDIHRWSDDATRSLRMGLITIPGEPGLAGHSDADVVTHALIDALLGAAGLGDIGEHFSDRDERFRGANSADLLKVTMAMIHEAGFTLGNADVTVIAESPRLGSFKALMAEALSTHCGGPVSVKATTMEGLGSLGNREGVAALAVALLKEQA